MVLSSDRLSGLGKPLLQLKLDTTTSVEGVVKEHLVEMDLQELDRLLNGLKSAQAVRVDTNHLKRKTCFYSSCRAVLNTPSSPPSSFPCFLGGSAVDAVAEQPSLELVEEHAERMGALL
jgi:hypothetical protein